jgi:hypothetical protein
VEKSAYPLSMHRVATTEVYGDSSSTRVGCVISFPPPPSKTPRRGVWIGRIGMGYGASTEKLGSRTGYAQDCPYRCRNPAFLDASCVVAVHPGVPRADPRAWESYPTTRPSWFGLSAAPTPSVPALTGIGAPRLPSSIAIPFFRSHPPEAFPSTVRAPFRGRTHPGVFPAPPALFILSRGPPHRVRTPIPPCPSFTRTVGRSTFFLSLTS